MLALILPNVVSFLVSVLLCPVVIYVCKKGNYFDEWNPRKLHSGNIPRFGGVAVFSGIVAGGLLVFFLQSVKLSLSSCLVILGGILIFIIGFIDDYKDTRAKIKFGGQLVIATLVCCSDYTFNSILGHELPFLLGKFVTFGWILLIVNSYNLIDGMDWLCSGISLLTIAPIAPIYWHNGLIEWQVISVIIFAIAGFMVWNKPNAKIFLGDCGSTLIGYCVALFPLIDNTGSVYSYNKVFICLLLTAIPTIDVYAAIIRRKRDGRKIFSADRAHLHHKLINIGFPQALVRTVIFTLQILIDLVILTVCIKSRKFGFITLFLGYASIIVLFSILHYVNLDVNKHGAGILPSNPQEEH